MKKLATTILLLTFLGPINGQCLDGDCISGDGEFKFKNGVYVGEFLNGKPNGQGLFKSKKGYTYSGEWKDGLQSGYGLESTRKGFMYEGEFLEGLRHGGGKSKHLNTKLQTNISYTGEWISGSICGEGTLTYSREVKYGRSKEMETSVLSGNFINQVFQGEIMSPYDDELTWESFNLSRDHFRMNKTEPANLKKLKNSASIEGGVKVSCECVNNIIIVESRAFLRKSKSWWSVSNPPKTKDLLLQGRQGEFDVIEWYARMFQSSINKQKLTCNSSSIELIFQQLYALNKDLAQTRKQYNVDTAWNPKRGGVKNPTPQAKWNTKVSNKLKKYKKINDKFNSKLKKKTAKKNYINNCVEEQAYNIPIYKETEEESVEEVVREKRSYKPTFPRKNQLR